MTDSLSLPGLIEEEVPLIPSSATASNVKAGYGEKPEHEVAHNDKFVFYDHNSMLTWRTALNFSSSVFRLEPVLYMLLSCVMIATGSAVSVIAFIPHARRFDAEIFDMFLTFLKVFISFMLGVYIQQSFSQWWQIVTYFGKYLTSIRQMIFFIHSVRLKNDFIFMVQRLALAGSYVLNMEVVNMQELGRGREGCMSQTLSWLLDKGFLEEDELKQLQKIDNHRNMKQIFSPLALTSTVWAWIGEVMAESETEEGKKLAAAMYARLLVHCQEPVDHLEEMKVVLVAQVPYMYCQLLTFLVYINNAFLALSCGLTIGSSIGEIMERSQHSDPGSGESSSQAEIYRAAQQVAVRMMILLCEPMLYIAFLQIGHMLLYPFGEEKHHLPTETMIARLQVDLKILSEGRRWSGKRRRKKVEDLDDQV
mmetsp:Transcript_13374/g.31370  ORF Transcript_13374/g.31370 Transcript_13374/m.31370 type:complete len:421 (+) Transcript_13374:114-1376(+)|eukprot:CAMPEP_0178427938 /NCGR_PEP_ID=MMETSP0689_2-20121128/30010_1 /TAXON_ID=160604 /ORGANISM="Amphidinium massartii, Strain CS-259" /LENGTH=420 /DNA_ID=CAMNT_0020049675 /DNA_START=26 /DNA_END=1288 /DNA_ORIENTATION=-